MNKWVALFFICFFPSISPQTIISPQFSELKGMEDQQGNTHLFYRIYSSYSNDPFYNTNNDIFHFDLASDVDTLFLADYSHEDPVMSFFRSVEDYDFWNRDFTKFIFCGSMGSWEPGPYIKRYDGDYVFLNYLCCEVNQLDISNGNDSTLFAGGWVEDGCIQSIDGGYNWNPVVDSLLFLSLNPYNDNILFLDSFAGFLYRSTDAGNSFHLVDVLNQPAHSTSFIFDPDQLQIYRLYSNRTLRVSPNNGEPFTWETKYSSDSKIFISNDESTSGTIYLADKKNIFISTDYGDNFTLYNTLDRKIVGIYKKPPAGGESNKIYVATKYKIYEITPDTIQIIKSLPIPEEALNLFPLAIGNYWVYSVYTHESGNKIYWGDETRSIVDIPTSNLGWQVFAYQSKFLNGDIDTTYIKLDSLSGKLFASSTGYGDYLFYEDLLVEAGDTVCYEYNPAWNCQFVQPDSQFTEFGLTTTIKKYFPQAPGWYFGHSLVRGIGLYELYNGDLTTFQSVLKGCIIDGIVYGDTTVVSVEIEEPPVISTFKLFQNYPNPFNPSTKISFIIGHPSLVTLKVFDVLGNEIATLVNEEKPAGEYEIEFIANGHSGEVRNLTSGIYFYLLKAGSFIQTKKMILLK